MRIKNNDLFSFAKSFKCPQKRLIWLFILLFGTGLQLYATPYNIVKVSVLSILQKTKEISGVVLDDKGEPVIGANISIKGQKLGTMTDLNGNFTLKVSDKNVTLVVSCIGYLTQEVSSNNLKKIVMQQSSQNLDEVVVVGYGVQKKVNLTGSISSVGQDRLMNRPITNSSTALQGLLAGVTVIQNSGQPGKDNSSIRVRGIGTLNNASPMFIVDGISVSTINDLDPNDIDNISVLKDAASSAIYGARASNGVILITTKKGKNQKTQLKYDGYVGWQSPTALQEYLPSHEYAALYNKALINENKSAIYTPEQIQKFKDGSDPDNYPNTDWLGLLYKKSGFQQSHRAEVSGGNEKTSYMFSLGYLSQDGIIKNSDHKRYNVRMNTNTQIGKFSAGLNLSYVYGDTNEPSNPYTGDMYQILRQINRIAPFVVNKYSNGYYGYTNDGNPVEWVENGSIRNEKYHTTRGVGNISYSILDGLKIQQILGYEYKGSSDEKFIKDSQYYNWKDGSKALYQGPNSQTDLRTSDMTVNLQSLLTYNKTIKKHSLNLILGYSQEYNRFDLTKGYRKNFLNNDLHEINAGSPDGQESGGYAYESALRSFFGRVSYDFDNKYLFEANVRKDGVSRIGKDYRWGTFPSFSVGWRVINEPFMEIVKNIVSDLKLRAGWGMLGNQNIGKPSDANDILNYPYQSVLSQANYSLGGKVVQGVAPIDGANSNIKWESSKTTNIGLDLGILNNMFTLSVDAYWRNTYDMLLKLPSPTPYGLTSPYQNAGKVRNSGIEFQLGYRLAQKGYTLNTSFNASYNENKIIDLKNGGKRIWDGSTFLQEGYPINSLGGYEVLGIFKTKEEVDASPVINRAQAGPGDLIYKDQNGDKKIDGADRVYLGSWAPKVVFGFNVDATYKNFDLSIQLTGAANVKGYLQHETVGRLAGNAEKPTAVFRDSWDAISNPNGNFPRPLSSWLQNDSENTPSSFWVINSSYLRFKNIQLGYTLPKSICDKLNISRIRVYYSGQNLLTISGFTKGFDPEAPVGARAYYPQVKVNTIGLNLTF